MMREHGNNRNALNDTDNVKPRSNNDMRSTTSKLSVKSTLGNLLERRNTQERPEKVYTTIE